MSFGRFDGEGLGSTQANAEINMVPLIDVMLVLLVIFLITAPLLTHSINVQLPRANAQAIDAQQAAIDVAITAEGDVYVDETLVEITDLSGYLAGMSAEQTEREVRIRADEAVPYGVLAETMSILKDSGLHKIGFVTQAKTE